MQKKVALVLTAMMVAGVVWGAMQSIEKAMSVRYQWPAVQGTVTSSRATKLPTSDGEPPDGFHVTARFTYEVDGSRYSAVQDWLGMGPWSYSVTGEQYLQESWWQEYPKPMETGEGGKYSPGTMVTIYYNPVRPEKAVVVRAEWAFWWGLIVYIPILGIIGCFLIWGWVASISENKTGESGSSTGGNP